MDAVYRIKELLVIFETSDANIPMNEMMIALIAITLCLLFRRASLGLFCAYFFVYRWGWIFLLEHVGGWQSNFFLTYVILGIIIPILCLIRISHIDEH